MTKRYTILELLDENVFEMRVFGAANRAEVQAYVADIQAAAKDDKLFTLSKDMQKWSDERANGEALLATVSVVVQDKAHTPEERYRAISRMLPVVAD